MSHASRLAGYSPSRYRRILELILDEGYEIADFEVGSSPSNDRRLILRHDVDYSMKAAVELAEINRSYRIRGTFFLQARSQMYNLLSRWSLAYARRLVDLDQGIALHYSIPNPTGADEKELLEGVSRDFELLEREIPEARPVFAWHNPSSEIIARGRNLEFPGLVNVYSRPFLDEMLYRADSNMRHSASELAREIRNPATRSLHLLLHPVLWMVGGDRMIEALAGAWEYMLQEQEEEISTGGNPVWMSHFPNGLSKSILRGFRNAILERADL